MTPQKAALILDLSAPPRDDTTLTESELDAKARAMQERQDIEDQWYDATEGKYSGPRAVKPTVQEAVKPTLKRSKPRIRR